MKAFLVSHLEEVIVTPDDPIAEKLKKLYREFLSLVENIKSELHEQIEKRTLQLIKIASYIGEYFRVKGLTRARDIHELFEDLWPHYNYLDCEVLEAIIENEDFLLVMLKKDMLAYKQHLKEFNTSTTLKEFKNAVEKALIPNPKVTATTCEVVIKVNQQWGKKTLENFKTLVNSMFHQRMTHIRVEVGSICITLH